MNEDFVDTELVILENIYNAGRKPTTLRQRDLAHVAGASLGMTNTIMKRLVKKGWVSVGKMNSRNFHYAVTPDGINEIARRTYRYFKRTIRNVVFYREEIDTAIATAKRRGFSVVLLIGISDLEFIVEHACIRHGISFLKVIDLTTAASVVSEKIFPIYAESLGKYEEDKNRKHGLYLARLLGMNMQEDE